MKGRLYKVDNLTAVFEWLNIYKGTDREFIGMYKGVPMLTTTHFRQRTNERYPKEVEMILGVMLTDFYEDVATDYSKYAINRYHKGAIDYTTECTNHNKEKFIVNLMINYTADKVSAGNQELDKKLNDLRSLYLRQSDKAKRAEIYREFATEVQKNIDPKYQDLVIKGKIILGQYALAMVTVFGSVATPEDIKIGRLRKIKPSEDTRHLGHRTLKRTSFNESEYNRLVKWSNDNIGRAARRKSRDVTTVNEFTVL